MEALVIVGFVTVVGALIAFSSKQNQQIWESVAEDVGLTFSSASPSGMRLEGELRGFDIVIDRHTKDKRAAIRATISGLTSEFTLGSDSGLQRMIEADIETGDQRFDEQTRIEGDADWALALLCEETRRLTEIVISRWYGELKDGCLVALYDDIQSTGSTLDTLLDLAHRLRQPPSHELPERLLERACGDPSDTVRFQAFCRLAAAVEFRKEAVEAAESLLGSKSDALNLEACRLLTQSTSKKSNRAARELATMATGQSVETPVRCLAIEILVESGHRQTTLSTLGEILRQTDTPTGVRSAALEGLIQAEARDELLEVQIDGEVEAEILARGLGRFDVSVQPRLLQLLKDSGHRVQLAAVESLGLVGDLDAILALRQFADQDGLLRSPVADEAEYAISEIKSRADGSQQGEISIIDVAPLDGAISPSEDSEGGEVSLTS